MPSHTLSHAIRRALFATAAASTAALPIVAHAQAAEESQTTTLDRIEAIINGMEGGEIVKKEPGYLYAQFTTRIMKYVDDAEFWFDPAENVIQVRSASRLGSGDFGVNRKRIEFIREKLNSS